MAASEAHDAIGVGRKSAVGMTRAAALDGAPDRVRVNALLPGTTLTWMMEEQMRSRPGDWAGP